MRTDDESLRRFVACRDAGDAAGARQWWARLLEENFDRIRGMVDAWGWQRLSPDEREEAFSLACVKLWRNMISTFAGTSMGEWVNATRRCVEFACADVQRAAARRSAAEASLDAAEAHERRRAEEEQRRAEERDDARDAVAHALPRLADARQRVVVERTLDGVPAEAIAAELGVSMDNLYQLRSRGLKALGRLMREGESAP